MRSKPDYRSSTRASRIYARRWPPDQHAAEHGEPEQAKALLAILIAELRVNSRNEILPTYRVGAPVVCAPNSSVGETWLCANHAVMVAPAVAVG
jgi:hypothetical protein